MADPSAIDWLLDGDPAVRWQTLRDLCDAPASTVIAERARVATEGWGAELLALRGPDGQWAGGAFWPTDPPVAAGEGQPWTATLFTLAQLRDFGLDPRSDVARETTDLISRHSRWENDAQPFFAGETEPCINGRLVSVGAYFGHDVDAVVVRLLGEQQVDGGWNCEAENGSVRGSFDTTINVLEGLSAWEHATGGAADVAAARRRGEEYLLERNLLRRSTTGELVQPGYASFSYPPRWHYDALRGLEHFAATGAPADPRVTEAIELVRSKQEPDGRWLLEDTHRGRVHFDLEDGDGQPSRWNTLRALRVLRWFDAG